MKESKEGLKSFYKNNTSQLTTNTKKSNTMNETTQLSHGQQIVIPSFRFHNKIQLVTPRGYALNNGDCPDEAEARALKNDWDFLACFKDCSIITADYEGKAEKQQAEHKEWKEAQRINEGDIVECEGRKYEVKILGEHLSDPVKFIPAK